MAFYVDPETLEVHAFRIHSATEIQLENGRVLPDTGEVHQLQFATVESAATFSALLMLSDNLEETKEAHEYWLGKLKEGQERKRKL